MTRKINKKTGMEEIHTIEGYWYKTPLIILHTCCKCKSKHIVKFKIKKGKLYSKWKPIEHT